MINILNDISPASSIVYLIVALLVLGGVSYFLFRSVRKTIRQERENKRFNIEGLITKSEMNSLVATYISRTGGESFFSLIYIDLDKFEDFANAFGNKEARRAIKETAYKIKAHLPRNCYLSRYTDDEFVVFVPNHYNRGEVIEIGEDILQAFRDKMVIYDDVEIDLTASIAIAQYPNHGRTMKDLLQSLLLSIHNIKKEGGNNLKLYSSSFEDEEEEMNYYYQIKQAIKNKEFTLYYQPMIDIAENKVYALEALLRWNHPELGVLSPIKFINIMEQTGDINWVGLWGFEVIVKKHLELRTKLGYSPLMSINISPKQLMEKNLADELYKIVRRNKVEPSDFIVEINEFLIFDRQQTILENLKKIKTYGFNIAIDEFGIDITSFDELEELGIDIFKIDYKFINEDSFSVRKYMEVFSEYVNKNDNIIICQGIEDESSEERAKQFEITKMQGYYYSKPMKETDLEDFLNKKMSISFENVPKKTKD